MHSLRRVQKGCEIFPYASPKSLLLEQKGEVTCSTSGENRNIPIVLLHDHYYAVSTHQAPMPPPPEGEEGSNTVQAWTVEGTLQSTDFVRS